VIGVEATPPSLSVAVTHQAPEVIDLTDDLDNIPTPTLMSDMEYNAADDDGEEEEDGDINPDADADAPLASAERAAALQSAIATAPISRLREVCVRLSLGSSQIADALAEELLGVSGDTGEILPKWAICVHCGEEYAPHAQGDGGDCLIHPGML
jgi:hypothetical protein